MTHRNIVGAFFGGVLGILACYFFGAYLLPIGCITGVFGGWFYQELLTLPVRGYKHSSVVVDACMDRLAKSKTLFPSWRPSRKSWITSISLLVALAICSRYMGIIPSILMMLLIAAVSTLFHKLWCFIGSPLWKMFSNWLKQHPMNQAKMLRLITGLIFLATNIRWLIIPLVVKSGKISTQPDSFLSIFTPVVTVLGLIFFLLFSVTFKNEKIDSVYSMRGFYRSWERYGKSKVWFFVCDLVQLFLAELITSAWMCFGLIWWIGFGGLFTLLILAPICVVVDGTKAYYAVANKGKHWMCLGCVFVSTGYVYWATRSHLHDPRFTYLIALSAGTLSAFVAQTVLHLSLKYVDGNQYLTKILTTPIKNYLAPCRQRFLSVTSVVWNWVFRITMAPIDPNYSI